ncbi:30S ribosomal protein S16 [Chlamydia trachomatis]|nr:30S ribosomal protein S16 [Chlamydia trachomatis]
MNQGAELTEKAGALVKQGAPGVYAELMAKKVARRAVVRQKRRAYRQRLAARKAEAAAK